MPKQFLSINEAATRLGVSTKTLRRWEEKGVISPKRTIGNQRRYSIADIEKADRQSLTIHEASARLGVSTKTLRRWEEKGVVTPQRTSGNQRRYAVADIESIKDKTPKQILTKKVKKQAAKDLLSLEKERFFDVASIKTTVAPKAPIAVESEPLATKYEPIATDFSPVVADLPQKPASKRRFSHYTRSINRQTLQWGGAFLSVIALIFFVNSLSQVSVPVKLLSLLPYLNKIDTTREHKVESNNEVLASQTQAHDFRMKVSVPAEFLSTASVSGKLTAPNILYSVVAGNNITISGDRQNPTISANLALDAGLGITVDNGTITNADPGSAQKIFGNIKVGTTTIAAGNNTDTFELAAGDNISLSADSSNKKITISSTGSSSSGISGVTVQEGDTTVASNITTFDYLGGDFDVGESPTGEANISLASTLTSVTGVAGNFAVGGNLTVGTDTINDFTGSGLSVSSNTLAINLTTSGTTGATSSNSGLEVSGSGLTLLKGCADNEILKYTDAGGWACASDAGAGGSVGGVGAQNQIAYWTNATTLAGSNNFYWDSTNEKFGIGTNGAPTGKLDVNGFAAGKALAILNETGDQNILTASASGVTQLNLDRSGNLAIEGSLSDLSNSVLTINDDLKVTGNDIIDSTDTTRISLGATTTLTNSNLTLSGTTTLDATSLTAINGGATAINFNEFAVSGTDGGITINDDANAGHVTVEGSRFDIDSLDFVGTGAITTAAGNDLTITAGGGNVLFSNGTTLNVGGAAATAFNFFADDTSGATTPASDNDLYIQGDLEVDGTIRLNNQTYTFPTTSGSNGYTLTTNGSGTLSWTDTTTLGTNYWDQLSGVLTPKIETQDLLLGSQATGSAKFAFINVGNGTPTASISGTGNNALSLNGNGTIQTFNSQSLTLGGSNTGNIVLSGFGAGVVHTNASGVLSSSDVALGTETTGNYVATVTGNSQINVTGSGSENAAVSLAITANSIGDTELAFDTGQNLTTSSTPTFSTLSLTSLIVAGDTINDFTGTGLVMSGNSLTTTLGVSVDLTSEVTGILPLANGGTGLNIDSSTITDGQLLIGNDSANGFTLANLTAGTGIAITNAAGSITIAQNPFGASKWTQNSTDGTLYPNLSTLDVLVGGVSTSSAKFAVLNVNSGTPVASLSAGLTGGAFLTADGQLQTTAKQSLTLGGGATGNVVVSGLATGIVHSTSGVLSSSDVLLGTETTGNYVATLTGNSQINVTGSGSENAAVSLAITANSIGDTELAFDTGQNLTTSSTPTFAGIIVNSDTITDFTGTGLVMSGNSLTTTLGVSVDLTSEVTGILPLANGGTGLNIDSSTITDGQLLIGNDSANGFTLANLTAGAGIAITNAAGSITIAQNPFGASKWTQDNTNGILYPNISTLDVLLGGTSSTGAKFAFLNNASGTPVASIAGNLTLDNTGSIQTTKDQTLTIGGDKTGNIVLSPLNGLGTLALNASALTINGVTGATTASLTCVSVTDGVVTGTGSCGAGNGGSVWTLNSGNGTLYPINSTVDLLIGGIATDSAKFAVINVNSGTPTASISGTGNNALSLDGNGTIGTTNEQTLTLGSTATGNINFVIGAGNNLSINGVAGANVSANCVNVSNGIVTSSATCPSAATSFIWNTNLGAIFEGNTTQDLLIGSVATSSAKFAVLNVNSGTPVASLSAGTAGGAFLTADGQLQTTAKQSLTLGGGATGNVVVSGLATGIVHSTSGVLSSSDVLLGTETTGNYVATITGNSQINVTGSGSENAAVSLAITANSIGDTELAFDTGQNLTTSSTPTFAGITVNSDTITDFTGTGLVMSGNSLTTTLGVSVDLTSEVNGILPIANGGSPFEQANGAIFERIANQDLLLGSNATASAKFAVINVGNGTPTASISGTGNNALSLDGNGTIQTSNKQTLTLGSASTGNIVLGNTGFTTCSALETINGVLSCGVDDVGGSTNYWQLLSGAISPFSETLDVLVGSTATSSAEFALTGIAAGTPTASLSATTNGNGLSLSASNATIQSLNLGTLTLGGTTTGNIAIGTDATARTVTIGNNTGASAVNVNAGTGNINLTASTGTINFDDTRTGVIPFSLSATALNTPTNAIIDAINEAYDASVGGGSGVWSTASNAIYPSAIQRRVGVGTTTAAEVISSFYVTRNLASGALGKAVAIFNQTENQDIFAASASGVTKFVLTNAGNASASAGFTINSAGTLQTTNNQTLTLGGNTTGNIVLSDLAIANAGLTVPSGQTTTLASFTTDGGLLYTNGSGVVAQTTAGNLGECLISAGGGTPNWGSCTGNGGTNWNVTNGTISPKLASTLDFLLGGSATASAKFAVLNINPGSGTPTASVSAGATGGMYISANGTLATTTKQSLTIGDANTGDLNLGTDATVRNIAIGNSTGGSSLTLDSGTGGINIGDNANMKTIDIGGVNNSGTDTIRIATEGTTADTITIGNSNAGTTLALTGGTAWSISTLGVATFAQLNVDNLRLDNNTFSAQSGDITIDAAGGDIVSTDRLTLGSVTPTTLATLDVRALSGTLSVATVSGQTAFASLVVDNAGNGDIFTASASGRTRLALSNAGELRFYDADGSNYTGFKTQNMTSNSVYTFPAALPGTNDYILSSQTDGSLAWVDPGTLPSVNFWDRANGALSPKNAESNDLLLGSTATNSAEFAITGISSGTPTASLSATTNGNGLSLTASNSTIQSLRNNTLTIGGNTTGNIVLDSGSGLITLVDPTSLSSTLAVAGAFNANADVVLGDAVTDNIIFSGRVAQDSDLTPITATGTNDLGAPGLEWDNLYVNSITQNGATLNATYAPINANFITVTANATLTGETGIDALTTAISTTSTLNVDGASTLGAVTLDPNANLILSAGTGKLGIGTTNPISAFDVRGNSGTTSVATISGNTSFASLVIDNAGTGDLFTASKGGVPTFTVQNNGIIVDSNYATAGGIFYGTSTGAFALSAAGTAGQILQSNGTGAPTWLPANSLNFWQRNLGALAPDLLTNDLLLGANSTASAKFAFINVAGGTPTATISGTGNNALSLDGNGNIGTTNRQTLTLGTASTGDINFVVGGSNKLRINGTAGATVGAATCVTAVNGIVTGTGSCDSPISSFLWSSNTGAIVEGNTTMDLLLGSVSTDSAKFAVTNIAGGTPTASLSAGINGGLYLTADGNLQTTAFQQLNIGGTSTGNISISPKNGAGTLALNVGTLTINGATGVTSVSPTCVSFTKGIVTGSGACGAGAGGSVWTMNTTDGTIYPINSTLDLVIGGVSTASAKFAVINVAGGTPVASVSAGTAGAAFLTASGNLQTTAKQSLTLGGGNTGNVVLSGAGVGIIHSNASGVLSSSAINLTGGSNEITGILPIANGGSPFEQTANGAIIERITTQDFLLGSQATTSAKFAVINIAGSLTPVASLSAGTAGGTFLTADGQLQTTAKQSLTFGGGNTGNIVLSGFTTGIIHSNASGVLSSSAVDLASADVTGILPSSKGGSNWDVLSGAITPKFSSVLDLLIGGTSSTSARFHAYGSLNSGTTPAASISANSNSFAGLVIDQKGTGDIFTASKAGVPTFTIQNNGAIVASNYQLNGGIFYADATGKLIQVQGAANTLLHGNGAAAPTFSAVDLASADVTGILPSSKGGSNWDVLSGTITPKFSSVLDLLIGGTSSTSARFHAYGSLNSGTTPAASISANSNSFAGLVVDNRGLGDLFTASSSGLTRFTIGQTGNIQFTGNTNFVTTLTSAATAAQTITFPNATGTICLSSNNCAADQIWNTNLGAIIEGNTTQDLLLGGTATTSSKFAFTGVAGLSTPVASIAATPSSGTTNGLSLSGTGTIQSLNKNTLTIGGSTTGDIAIANQIITTSGDLILNPFDEVYLADGKNLVIGGHPGNVNYNVISNSTNTSHGLNADNDLFIEGQLEVDGVVSFDNATINLGNTAFANCSVLTSVSNVLTCGTSSGVSDWNVVSGTIQPKLASAVDLLIGGISSSSARFHAYGSINSGTTPSASIAATSSFAALVIDQANGARGGDLLTASSSGLTRFTIGQTGNIQFTGNTNFLTTLTSAATAANTVTFPAGNGTVCYQTSTNCGFALGTNFWQSVNTGSITPYITTVDTLFGGVSTASASLRIAGSINSATQPAASISANTNFAALVVDNKGAGDLFTASSSGLSRFVIQNNGNVGIGTSLPGAQLQISNANSGGTNNVQMFVSNNGSARLDTNGTNLLVNFFTGNSLVLGGAGIFGGADATFQHYGDNVLYRNFDSASAIQVNDAGNNLFFNVSTLDTMPVASIGATSNFAAMVVDNRGSGDLFTASSSGLNRFVINQNGNIGVGTTIANAMLHIKADGPLGNLANAGIEVNAMRNAPLISTDSAKALLVLNNQTPSNSVSLMGNYQSSGFLVGQYSNSASAFQGFSSRSSTSFVGSFNNWANPSTDPTSGTYMKFDGSNGWLYVNVPNTSSNSTIARFEGGSNPAWSGGTLVISGDGGISSSTTPLGNLDVRGRLASISHVSVATISGKSVKAALAVDNMGPGDLFTASSSGLTRFTIKQNGDIAFTAGLSANGSIGTNVQCLLGGTTATWGSCAGGTNFWQSVNAGSITPYITTVDTLFGGVSTSSASLRIAGSINSATQPAASISANTNFAGLVVDNKGAGDLFTASSAGLNRFVITQNGNVGIGTTTPTQKLDVFSSTATTKISSHVTGTANAAYVYTQNDTDGNYIEMSAQGSTVGGTQFGQSIAGSSMLLFSPKTTGSGLLGTISNAPFVIGTNNTERLRIGNTATIAIASISGSTNFAGLLVDNSGRGDLFTASSSGLTRFTIGQTGNIQFTGNTNFLTTLTSAASQARTITFPDATGNVCLSTNNCGYVLGTNFWQSVNAGSITPYITTVDTLFGGVSTASASLRIAGSINSATQPAASISANTNFAAFVVDNKGNGDLFTASSSGLERFTIQQNGNVVISGGNLSTLPATNGINLGPGFASANPRFINVREFSNASAGSAIYVGNWSGATYWGIGPASSNSTNNAIRIGLVGANSNTWSTSQSVRLILNGTPGDLALASLDVRGGLDTIAAASVSAHSNSFAAMVVDNSGSGDIFTASSSGLTRLVINQNGNVGIGTTSADRALQVDATTIAAVHLRRVGNATGGSNIQFENGAGYQWEVGAAGSSSQSMFTIIDRTVSGGPFRFVIDTSGNAGLGAGTSNSNLRASFDVKGNTATTPMASFSGSTNFAGLVVDNSGSGDLFTASSSGLPRFVIKQDSTIQAYGFGYQSNGFGSQSRVQLARANGTQTAPTAVVADDVTSQFVSTAYDGTNYISVADILTAVDGTPGTSDMPGRIMFRTVKDGQAGLTERMRITNAGYIGIGTGTPLAILDVRGESSNPTTNNTMPVASFSAKSTFASMVVDNSGSGDIFTASSSGLTRFTIKQNGDVAFTKGITLNGTNGTAAQCLIGGTTATWGSCTGGTNFWQSVNAGTITPYITTVDTLFGGVSTASASFHVYGSAGNTTNPAASVSATTTGTAFVIDNAGTGKLLEVNSSGLNRFVVNQAGNVGIDLPNNISPSAALQVGNFADGGNAPRMIMVGEYTTTLANGSVQYGGNWNTNGTWGLGLATNTNSDKSVRLGITTSGAYDTWNSTQSIRLVLNGALGHSGLGALDVGAATATLPVASFSGSTNFAGLVVDNSGSGDLFTASSSGLTRFVITQDGDVQIGTLNGGGSTASPDLQLASTINSSVTWAESAVAFVKAKYYPATNYLAFEDENATILAIDRDTNSVGIGGITVPFATLDVTAASDTLAVASISGKSNSFAAMVVDNKGTGDIFTASSSGLNRFVIKNNGNVGIGTTTPTTLLTVGDISTMGLFLNNSVSTADDPYSLGISAGAANSTRRISFVSQEGANQQALQFGDGVTTDSIFGIGSSTDTGTTWNPRFVITQNGTVGIGTKTHLASLDVRGNTANGGTIAVASVSGRTSFAALVADNTLGDLFTASSSGLTRFVIKQNGSVIIGSATGSGRLKVVPLTDDTTLQDGLQVADRTQSGYFFADYKSIGTTTPYALIGAWSDTASAHQNLVLGAGSTKVGVLNNNPTTALDVTGVINASTNVTVNGVSVCLTSGNCSGLSQYWTAIGNAISPSGAANATSDLLIGGISTASARFHVYGSVNGATTPVASVAGVTNYAAFVVDNRGAGDLFTASSSGLTRFVINQAGNVGIGTTTPITTLDVRGVAGTPVASFSANSSTTGVVAEQSGTGAVFRAATSGLNRFVVMNDGRVGIDTFSSPLSTAALQIGNISDVGAIAPRYVGVFEYSTNATFATGFAQYVGNWANNGFWGIGPATNSNTDNSVRLGITSGSNSVFNSTQSLKLAINGALGRANAALDVGVASATLPVASFSGSTNFAGMVVDNSGAGDLFTASSSGLTRFTIKQNGNVEIGNNNYLTFDSGAGNASIRYNSAFNTVGIANAGPLQIASTTFFLKDTGGNTYFTGDASNRRIGINTSSPLAALDVRPNSATLAIASVSGRTSFAALTVDNSHGDLFTASSSGLTRFIIANNGNVTLKASTSALLNVENAQGADLLTVDSLNNKIDLLTSTTGLLSANSWSSTSTLATAHDGSTVVTANGYLYNIGGASGGAYTAATDVEYARINTDGTLGTWKTTSSLPNSGRSEHATVVANGYVYVLGGTNNGAPVNTVYYGKLNPDGTISGWKTTTGMPNTLMEESAVVMGNYVYVIGGFTGGTTWSSSVYYAKLNADGTIGLWSTATQSIPAVRSNTTAVTANGYIYVLGGKDGTALPGGVLNTVFYARPNSDGDITNAWVTTSLPAARQLGSSVVSNGYIYYIAGKTSADGTISDVYYAPLNSDGSIGSWNTTTQLSQPRQNHASAIVNGYIYVVGGGDLTNFSSNTTYYISTARVRIGGNLDLIGLQGQTMASGSGDLSLGTTGGSLTAGNGMFVGGLQVLGQTNLSSSLTVGGTFNAYEGMFVQSSSTTAPVASISGTTSGTGLIVDNSGTGPILDARTNTVSRFYIGQNGNIGVGTTSPEGHINIVDTFDAVTAGTNNLGLFLRRNAATDGTGPGIGFASTTSTGIVGAKIVNIRTGSNSQGDLAFYAKGDQATGDTTRQVLRLSATGTSPIATFSGTTSFAGLLVDNSGAGDLFSASSSGLTRFTIAQNGNVRIGNSLTTDSPNPLSQLELVSTKNALADLSADSNYALKLWNTTGSNGTGPGIAFANTSNATNIGASILLNRLGSNSQGKLEFYTKSSTVIGDDPDLAFTLNAAGATASVSGRTGFAALVADNRGSGDLFTASSSGNTRFTIKQNGDVSISKNLGIGTTTPQSSLHITNGIGWFAGNNTPLPSAAGKGLGAGYDTSGDYAFLFGFDYGGGVAKNLVLNSPGAHVLIGTTTDSGKTLSVGSPCTNTGTNSCVDYAEFYNASEIVSPAEIVSLDTASSSGKLVHITTESYDQKAIGIAATNPAFVIEEGSSNIGGYKDGKVSPSTKPPIALAGRVPVKVSTINGTIKIGDYVTSSDLKGLGMKSTKAGIVVGKVMQDFDPANGKVGEGLIACPAGTPDGVICGQIFVFVNTSWHDPDVYLTTTGNINVFEKPNAPQLDGTSLFGVKDASGQEVNRVGVFKDAVVGNLTSGSINVQNLNLGGTDLNTKLLGLDNFASASAGLASPLASLQTQMQSLSDRVASLEAKLTASDSALFTNNPLGSFNASSGAELNLDKLNVNSSIIADSINVLSYATINELSVTGSIRTGVLTINGQATNGGASISTLNGDLKLQDQGFGGIDILNGLVTIDTTGNITSAGSITAKKFNVDTTDVSAASAGEAKIPTGQTSVIVNTTAVTTNSKIFVTSKTKTYQPLSVTAQTAGTSFKVEMVNTDTKDIKFSWFIIN